MLNRPFRLRDMLRLPRPWLICRRGLGLCRCGPDLDPASIISHGLARVQTHPGFTPAGRRLSICYKQLYNFLYIIYNCQQKVFDVYYKWKLPRLWCCTRAMGPAQRVWLCDDRGPNGRNPPKGFLQNCCQTDGAAGKQRVCSPALPAHCARTRGRFGLQDAGFLCGALQERRGIL